ncbi:FISUMP domain-containing protein [Flavobacterium sp. TMP13]|uniref:FISUMP domain-containing protein n=1 Tax=Flavobacterium sp. TMP13 TaxID=3425950 RepID=UPI003D77EEEC
MINKIEQIKELKMLLETGAIDQDQYSILLNEIIGNNVKVEEKKKEKFEQIVEDEYSTVTIGDQVWMTENLNIKTFRNGDSIIEASSKEQWETALKSETPAWCYYDDDPLNGEKLGLLYNYFAIYDRRGLAPTGWTIPTKFDFSTLLKNADTKALRSREGWSYYEIIEKVEEYLTYNSFELQSGKNGTNKSGFDLKPGGFYGKLIKWEFFMIESISVLWIKDSWDKFSSTDSENTSMHDYCYIYPNIVDNDRYYYDDIFETPLSDSYGYSVRCIKENEKEISIELSSSKLSEKILNYGKNILDAFKAVEYEVCKITALHDDSTIYYEIWPEAGFRLSKMKEVEKYFIYELSSKLNLSISDIKCLIPIPGKGTLGVEILFNSKTEILKEINIDIEKKMNLKFNEDTFHEKKNTSSFILPEVIKFDFSNKDLLFKEAAEIIVSTQQGSGSLLQRKLKIGYNRAGRLIDQLEAAGIVGPFEGSVTRKVKIIDIEELNLFYKKEELENVNKEGTEFPLENKTLSRKIFNLFLGKGEK